MQYFVVAPDGMKYGPADAETLKQWAAENRLEPNSLLEEAGTYQRLRADSVAGLFPAEEPATVPFEPPLIFENPPLSPAAAYPRATPSGLGSPELASAWVWTIVGIFVPIILPIVGLRFANNAIAKGNEEAHSARIFAITVLVAQLVIILAVGAIAAIFAIAISATS
jgi:hypothetical protein